jgi:excisionase family DNA binding protein
MNTAEALTEEPEPDLLTIAEAAKIARLSEHGFRNMVVAGQIPGVIRFGARRYRISRKVFMAYVNGEAS